ncbi:GAF domain-containing protein [Rhodoblastus sp.]|jgi:light-regulated signal transduction histidine kinase (bacteriophytochrome)|uniref:GAF domain-containing protein n=1 Tax=Rhodoblastus sp. TaxID=1962975 RepID=UPI0025F6B9F8|nr:GAF domain-containing protein [Rhodoblastus sp.]
MANSGSEDSQATTPKAGAIQPRGWAIVCDAQAARMVGHSANLAGLLPPAKGVFIGAALRDLVGSETSHALRNALSRASAAPRPSLLPFRPIAGCEGAFDFSVHGAGEQTIIEIERSAQPDLDALDRARALIDRLSRSDSLDKLALMAARLVFSVLQWDCVTILRLTPEGAAHALAQHKHPDWPDAAQFAALSADFSAESRDFYLGARLRFLSDCGAAPVDLIGAPAPDLALAHLRAATADEAGRAAKAGFAALLSMPIRVEGALWGLLLAHDRQPRSLNMNERAVFELFGDFLSLSVQSALWRQEAARTRSPSAL